MINNKKFYKLFQITLDKLLSITLLIFLLPLILIIIFLIKINSKGHIIHKRLVLGKNYKKFYFYKFRTMIENADDILEEWKNNHHHLYKEYKENIKLKEDPRITNIGRFLRKSSLDELPQFFNVLKGEMSLVGPRPISEEEIDKFNNEELELRLSVKPGITGYWQVNGRQEVSYEDRIKADIFYIKNRSLKMDIWILIKTIPAVISRKGAH